MAFEHSETVAWGDVGSDEESIGEIILNVMEGGDGNEGSEDIDNICLGETIDMQYQLNSDGESYRSLGPGSSPLCRFLAEHSTQNCVENGYVGSGGYVIPLHQVSMVPGHTVGRVGVCNTGTTRLGEKVNIQCYLNGVVNDNTLSGSLVLSNILESVHTSMSENDVLPQQFSTKATSSAQLDTSFMDMAPITLGCEDNVTTLRGLEVKIYGNRGQYVVPLDCPAKRYKVPSGLGATFIANNVVLMYPNVPQYLIPESERKPTEEQMGFLCCTSTSTSAALKGLVRYTACDVVCRCYNCGVGDEIMELCTMLCSKQCDCKGVGDKEIIMVAGVKVMMCINCVQGIEIMISIYSSKTPHCLTVHNSSVEHNGMAVKVLSFCTGTLMRWIEHETRWVDSKTEVEFAGNYRSVISPAVSLIPFIEHIHPVRASLVNVYLNQAICEPCNKYYPGVVLKPEYSEIPCVISDNCSYDDESSLKCIPGLNLFTIFVNLELTYEDAIVMSRSAARRFKYSSHTSVHLAPSGPRIPSIGEKISPFSTAWWQSHFEGIVVQKQAGPNATVTVIIKSMCLPVNGDKFTTLHGQKGVVTILDDIDMPSVYGKYAELVIGSSSIIKRGTPSQLLEAACGMYAQMHMDSSISHCTETVLKSYAMDYNVTRNVTTSILSRYESEVKVSKMQPMRKIVKPDNMSLTSAVRANYGIIRIMQSCFLASIRMSSTYECSGVHSTSVNTKSSEGGSKSLGEMECTQLMASGMTRCLEEFIERSDMCNVDMCRVCRCLRIVCICSDTKIECSESEISDVDVIKMPYRSIVSIVSWKVGFDINTKLNFNK